MKKLFFLFILYCLSVTQLSSQTPRAFGGHICYSINSVGSVGEVINEYLPKSLDIYCRKRDVRVHVNQSDIEDNVEQFLYLGKKKKCYQVHTDGTPLIEIPFSPQPIREFTLNEEQEELLAYPCIAYTAYSRDNDVEISQKIWVSSLSLPIGLGEFAIPILNHIVNPNVIGVPLLVEITLKKGGLSQKITIKAISILHTIPEKKLFKIPKNKQTKK